MSLSQERDRAPQVSDSVDAFLAEPHIATLSTIRPDGSLHAAPVRFTWDKEAGLARVMTVSSSRKARNLLAAPGSRVALCQAVGYSWVTLEGTARVSDDPLRVAEGARLYSRRYRSHAPTPPGRVVIEVVVDRVMSLNS
ncbi:pyridoxamine 5'-phosphate oxidase family protein [Streptomyces sp. NPDC060322]|uniref:pyridoxamine 5'-phosphate oxidase family protein n=1 Tax=unclassified Streptomyces TaxID=2593676 RepID=UPI00366A337B